MKKSIVVLGSSNTDMILHVPHIPVPGETVLGAKYMTAAGGKGANQAVAAARAGAAVSFIATVGQDSLGDQAVAGFVAEQIDISGVYRTTNAPSGIAMIFVEKSGQNAIAVSPGANGHLTPESLDETRLALIRESSVLLLQHEVPPETVEKAAIYADGYGKMVILNPAPALSIPPELYSALAFITPNETETEKLTGIVIDSVAAMKQAAAWFHDKGVASVIITLGKQGCFYSNGYVYQFFPAFAVNAVDTTAAGDIFNGALAAKLVEGSAAAEAIRFAQAAAALSVTKKGAQRSAPIRKAVDHFLQSQG